MKIAVTASGPGLKAAVDPRFGRCPYLVVVDDQTGEHTALRNPGLEMASGAGIATAEALVNEGVQVVITGNCGPRPTKYWRRPGSRW
jgi:predicted Fe-Mo cluster-binding NifX family protein